ncbi:MAG: hypothetical protein QOC66_2427 [Pseudonocardiales bacterium]|nr:hypothetical protein [Pseudonocardiales bacterium]
MIEVMAFLTDVVPSEPIPAPRRAPLRLFLLGRSAIVMVTSMFGVVLFCLWVTLVAISPLTIVAVLVLPVTAVVRWYAELRRRGAQRLLGTPVQGSYRPPPEKGAVARVWAIERDPASWRDTAWLLLHAIVGFVTSTLSFTLFAGGAFYLIYPFLYWVTPDPVFRNPFGDQWTLHSVSDAAAVMPAALVSFALWYVLVIPLARAEVSMTRAMLGRPADR